MHIKQIAQSQSGRTRYAVGLWFKKKKNRKKKSCTSPIFHNEPLCNKYVHTCAHFCYNVMHYGIFVWRIVGFARQTCSDMTNMRRTRISFPVMAANGHPRLPTFDQPLYYSRHFSFIIQVYQLPSVVLTYLTGIRPRKLAVIKIPVALSIKKGIEYLAGVWQKPSIDSVV